MFPRVIVIGALGRCGRGAVEMAHKMGIPKYANLFTLLQSCSSKMFFLLAELVKEERNEVFTH